MGDGDEAVAVNVTPLIDIIFCLCIFFMCSFHFRQLEGKMESWLPKDRGVNATPVKDVQLEEIRIFVRFNEKAADSSQAVSRAIGARAVTDDNNLREVLRALVSTNKQAGLGEVPVIIDAEPLVPWKDVIGVMNICKRNALEKIEFAAPLPGR